MPGYDDAIKAMTDRAKEEMKVPEELTLELINKKRALIKCPFLFMDC